MDIHFHLLSYALPQEECMSERLLRYSSGIILTSDNEVSVHFNARKIPFNQKSGQFTIKVEDDHDLKLGILEMVFKKRGILTDSVLGYSCKRIEEFVIGVGRKKNVFSVPVVKKDEVFEELMYKRKRRREEILERESVVLGVRVERVRRTSSSGLSPMLISLAGEETAFRVKDLRDVLGILFKNATEMAYGAIELRRYYMKMEGHEFKGCVLGRPRASRGIFSHLRSVWKKIVSGPGKKPSLEKALHPKNEYEWHIKASCFYEKHILNYKYALCSYGSRFITLHYLLNAFETPMEKCRCEGCRGPGSSEKKFLHRFLSVPHRDVFMIEDSAITFVLFVNRELGCLYISFKGTFKGRDALVDLDCKYVKYNGSYFHGGIFKESKRFLEERERRILEILEETGVGKIRMVGQSLGGALATLTAILMKERRAFSRYKVSSIGYSSPPFMTRVTEINRRSEGADEDSEMVTLIYGNDFVPTLCFGSVFELKVLANHLYAIDVKRYANKQTYIRNTLRRLRKKGVLKLYIPGVIYKMKKNRLLEGTVVMMRRTNWSEHAAIKVTRGMFTHHYPSTMLRALYTSAKYVQGNGGAG
jgi:pimeloyl-ACP methyl ester carboxylesterase